MQDVLPLQEFNPESIKPDHVMKLHELADGSSLWAAYILTENPWHDEIETKVIPFLRKSIEHYAGNCLLYEVSIIPPSVNGPLFYRWTVTVRCQARKKAKGC